MEQEFTKVILQRLIWKVKRDYFKLKRIGERRAGKAISLLQTCQDSSPLKIYNTCFFFTSGRIVLFSPLHWKNNIGLDPNNSCFLYISMESSVTTAALTNPAWTNKTKKMINYLSQLYIWIKKSLFFSISMIFNKKMRLYDIITISWMINSQHIFIFKQFAFLG